MSILWRLVCTLLLTFNLFYGPKVEAADEIGNGGGYYENLVAMAYLNLPFAIAKTLEKREFLTSYEGILLAKIANEASSIPAENILFFRPESDSVFAQNDYHRIAVTGSSPGSKIYFNLDMLYEKNVNYPQLISLLVHELGHHHDEMDHTYLDYLGHLVATEINPLTQRIKYDHRQESPEILITYLGMNDVLIESLYILKGDKKIDLKLLVEKELMLKNFMLHNLHWNDLETVEGHLVFRKESQEKVGRLVYDFKADSLRINLE